jgi:tRNA (guanine-N7-)-methyltransferase
MSLPENHPYPSRQIKSWVRREASLSAADKKILESSSCLIASVKNLESIIQNYRESNKKVFIDIGCGDGQSALQLASENPSACIIGVETHTPGIAKTLFNAQQKELHNVYIFQGDIWDILDMKISEYFDRIHLYFSDPWPKSRHHKRRLIQKDFLLALRRHMKPSSVLHIATDWRPYAEHIAEVLLNLEDRFLCSPVHLESMGKEFCRIPTKYERKGLEKQHTIFEFYMQSKREDQL